MPDDCVARVKNVPALSIMGNVPDARGADALPGLWRFGVARRPSRGAGH